MSSRSTIIKRSSLILEWISAALVAAAVVLVGVRILSAPSGSDAPAEAAALSRKIEKRLANIDALTETALSRDEALWVDFPKVREDVVLYRYQADTLESWVHTFPIHSDDLSDRLLIQRLGDNRSPLVSPLSKLTYEYSYVNLGSKWYLAKKTRRGERTVVSGLEIDPKIAKGYVITPLSGSVGSVVAVSRAAAAAGKAVSGAFSRTGSRSDAEETAISAEAEARIDGRLPLFKIASEDVRQSEGAASPLLWTAFLLAMAGLLAAAIARPVPRRMAIVLPLFAALTATGYFAGMRLGSIPLFSPIVYAGGPLLYSLGAVLLINALLTFTVFCVWLVRRGIARCHGHALLRVAAGILAIALIAVYIHLSFKSIVLNSSICLELYKIPSLSWHSAAVYLSYLLLSLSVPMILELMRPAAGALCRLRYHAFSQVGRLVFALVFAVYFVSVSSVAGFRKESNQVDVWANSLALDRDISLEIQLRAVEAGIGEDPIISSLSVLPTANGVIRSRIVDNYMGRIAQSYDISIVLIGDTPTRAQDAMLGERIRDGVRIAEDSHFFYSLSSGGRARYSGLYTFYSETNGASAVLMGVEPKSNREGGGYLSILGITEPGRVTVPAEYSYAKYHGGRLSAFKGPYPYPTVLPDDMLPPEGEEDAVVRRGGSVHFVHKVSTEATVVLSRSKVTVANYLVEGSLLAILAFFAISLFLIGKRRPRAPSKSYFRSRINLVFYVSLGLTLVTLATFSVWFVYRRNLAEQQDDMATKIGAITASVQSRLRMVENEEELRDQGILTALDNISTNLRGDINLYTTKGHLVLSTVPELLDRMLISRRINGEAYHNVRDLHSRFYIHREKLSGYSFYALYAPVFNHSGDMVAIISTPYTDDRADFRSDAVFHIVAIIVTFLILLMLARAVVGAIIRRMFAPLEEMGRKMSVQDVGHLEYIDYDREDEIAALVRSYNRMVRDLSESTELLARSERDKAWSEMARQVAHEIKNPLTPIKLQLQMLIRMKASGKGAWTEKFDEVAATVLSHIDILADTASEFSTFAKLYSEEPVSIDLDALLESEVSMFQGRGDIRFEYVGLSGAVVSGPKPQLTRVIVNLLTNAVQAVSASRSDGVVMVSLRNSVEEGFYDIVVEDNGPGVSEENVPKLFTPNFTTKSGGSGLGLAISRSIIDRCGGSIVYSKSPFLGGAAFTVRYPK